MAKIKLFLVTVASLLNLIGLAQVPVVKDTTSENIEKNINNRISQSQKDLENDQYYIAEKNLTEALILAEKSNNKKNIGIIYALKARLQLIIKQEKKAIELLDKAIKIQHVINDNENLGRSYKTYGDVHFYKKNYNTALTFYNTANSKFKKEGLHKELAETLLLKGKIFFFLKDFKNAKKVINEALDITEKHHLYNIQCNALHDYTLIHNELGNTQEAIKTSLASLNLAKKHHLVNKKKDIFLIISDLYNKSRNYKLSRQYLKNAYVLADSLNNASLINSPNNIKTRYLLDEEIEKNTKIIEKLEKIETNKNVGTLVSILSVALITILSLLTLSLYKNNNIRLKTNKMLHKKNGELIIAKEKAELASITKANFLSTVTHELRTPLYAVTGLSSMLLEDNPKPEQIQHLKSLKFSGDYLLTFINDILQINKIEANKVDIEPEPFNLKKKIQNIILALNNSAENNNIKIHFEYDQGLNENFIADQIKISQILINLIGNSIKFTKGGDIWIRVYKINETGNIHTLRFEVEDNGIGISQEKQDHMFESFSQGSIEINRKYGGTGLGLSIVKGLIDILKGKIYVKSELNKGTTFYFEIPLEFSKLEESNEAPKKYFEKTDLTLSNIKILVVEDNKINQMITKKILSKMNFTCDIVDNGEDAVEMIKNNNYDLVLMDIHMPGISGIEATKRVRAFNKDLTIFALTAVTIKDKMQEFEEAGFTDIIPKPFKHEEFEKKLHKALAAKNKN